MRAEVISVGTDCSWGRLWTPMRVSLQAAPSVWIDLHYRVHGRRQRPRLADALRTALARADVVFTIGGLGPTKDDLTKRDRRGVLGDEMVMHEESAEHMRSFFAARAYRCGVEPQAGDDPIARAGCFRTPWEQLWGGFRIRGKVVIVLPGPPREFIGMVDAQVVPYLR